MSRCRLTHPGGAPPGARSSGIKPPERKFRRSQLNLRMSGFYEDQHLGMPQAASLPPSRPVHPRELHCTNVGTMPPGSSRAWLIPRALRRKSADRTHMRRRPRPDAAAGVGNDDLDAPIAPASLGRFVARQRKVLAVPARAKRLRKMFCFASPWSRGRRRLTRANRPALPSRAIAFAPRRSAGNAQCNAGALPWAISHAAVK